MSYSRWSNSIWYTYWSSSSGDDKDSQVFSICDLSCPVDFTYKQLKESVDSCIKQVCDLNATPHTGKILSDIVRGENGEIDMIYEDIEYQPRYFSDKELQELKGYMEDFIADVDKEYT